MLGFGEIALFLLIVGVVASGIGYGLYRLWDGVVNTRRKHRLQAQEDERLHRKQMADDYAESAKMLEGLTANMSFEEYTNKTVEGTLKNRN